MATVTREVLQLLEYEVIETRELELPPFCGCDDLIKIEPSNGCCFPIDTIIEWRWRNKMKFNEIHNITDYDLINESFIDKAAKEITREIDKDILHKAFPTEERFEGWINRVKEIYYNEEVK